MTIRCHHWAARHLLLAAFQRFLEGRVLLPDRAVPAEPRRGLERRAWRPPDASAGSPPKGHVLWKARPGRDGDLSLPREARVALRPAIEAAVERPKGSSKAF